MTMSASKIEMEALATEIFELTGQKVEFDDPVVVAALIQSRMIRQGYLDGVATLKVTATEILGDAKKISEFEKDKLKIFRDSQNLAVRQSGDMVRALVKAELPKNRKEFYEVATEVILKVDRNENTKKLKVYLAVAAFFSIFAFLAGFFLGSELRTIPPAHPNHPESKLPRSF